jgi:hypothetical protein
VQKPAVAAVTKEQLEARLVELQQGKEQAMANVNAFVGAIAETQHWIELLNHPPETAQKPAPVPAQKK